MSPYGVFDGFLFLSLLIIFFTVDNIICIIFFFLGNSKSHVVANFKIPQGLQTEMDKDKINWMRDKSKLLYYVLP